MVKTLELENIIEPDDLGLEIANNFRTWSLSRAEKVSEWREIQQYIYAVNTTETSNASLPWKNKTTVPKLTQIRDNLHANYMRALFPKREWLDWEASDKESANPEKVKNIKNFAYWMVGQSKFQEIISKLVLDYIDYGNAIAMPDWVDNRQELETHDQVGYAGPIAKRVSPLDIVFNPTAATFTEAPKIVRSLVTLGDVKEILERLSTQEDAEANKQLFTYLRDLRNKATTFDGDLSVKDDLYKVDGFNSFRTYLGSGYCELLTYYGNLYDMNNDKYYRNHIFVVVDRHKLLISKPNPSYFGEPPIYHTGWRIRQDNLWAMGPLDNLVGMQYRLDHVENLKADIFDLTAFPPLKIKGMTEDFEWGPFARIYVGDDGDVEVLSPDVNALNANLEIMNLEQQMEEMAGAPKEALGFRTPGEKTKYEVQRLENAASRIFQSKIEQFEANIIEPLLNSMLELARRKMTRETIRVFDDEFKIEQFFTLTAEDITGSGRLKPVAARHFAEKAEALQNATAFFNSPMGQDPGIRVHMSGVALANMAEDLLEWEQYKIIQPYIGVSEQAEAQRLANTQQEQTLMEAQTPTGMTPEDFSGP